MAWLVSLFICLLAAGARAAEKTIPFTIPGNLPLSISLLLPDSGEVVSHQQTGKSEQVKARVKDDREVGLVVVAKDWSGRVLWRHDFGYDMSAPEGNSLKVTFEPSSRLLLIDYSGYKANHAHKLLFVGANPKSPSLREYSAADKDILPLIRKQGDFEGRRYWIYPLRLLSSGAEFECIPLNKPESNSVHPLAQEEPWFLVTTVATEGRIKPVSIRRKH